MCDSEQKELNAHLAQLEATLDTLPANTAADDDISRRETYQLAEEVDAHLATLHSTLNTTIATLNERVGGGGRGRAGPSGAGSGGGGSGGVDGYGGSGGGGVGLMGQLTDILNVHLQSLQWLEAEAAVMEQSLERTTQQMAAVHVVRDGGRDNGRGINNGGGSRLLGNGSSARVGGRY